MDSGASPWGEIQHDALARGELVYAMNEGWATLSEGVGYALGWIGLRAWGGDHAFSRPADPVDMPVADGGFKELSRDLALCRGAGGFLPRVDIVLRHYGVPVDARRYMQTTQPINARLVLARISHGEGLYCFEMSRAGGTHGIGVQRGAGVYRLFDCHYGHFAADGLRAFADLLERFLRAADYGRVYAKGTTVAGAARVGPPPTRRDAPEVQTVCPADSAPPPDRPSHAVTAR